MAKPAPVVVLSDGLWKRRFGADPQIVGRTLTLCCAPRQYTVVGVMPPGFKGLTDTAELWVPFALYAPEPAMAERGTRGFAALARLKPGVTLAAAQSELDGISRQLEQAYPDTNEKRAVEVSPLDVELFGDAAPGAADADGGRRLRAADRLRERRQPADRAVGSAAARDRGAHRARRRTRRGCCGS